MVRRRSRLRVVAALDRVCQPAARACSEPDSRATRSSAVTTEDRADENDELEDNRLGPPRDQQQRLCLAMPPRQMGRINGSPAGGAGHVFQTHTRQALFVRDSERQRSSISRSSIRLPLENLFQSDVKDVGDSERRFERGRVLAGFNRGDSLTCDANPPTEFCL